MYIFNSFDFLNLIQIFRLCALFYKSVIITWSLLGIKKSLGHAQIGLL